VQAVEIRTDVQASFNQEMQRRMSHTVWTSGCSSWYLDAHRHNTTLWPGFTWEYRRRTRRFNAAHYELTPSARASST
jgi:hypothetical protein